MGIHDGPVYFMRCLNFVKIGKGTPNYQTGCPFELEMLYIGEDLYEDEMHKKFEKYRMREFPNSHKRRRKGVEEKAERKNKNTNLYTIIKKQIEEEKINYNEYRKREFHFLAKLEEIKIEDCEKKQEEEWFNSINKVELFFPDIYVYYQQTYNQLILKQGSFAKGKIRIFIGEIELDFKETYSSFENSDKTGYIHVDCERGEYFYESRKYPNFPKQNYESKGNVRILLSDTLIRPSWNYYYRTISIIIKEKPVIIINEENIDHISSYLNDLHIIGNNVKSDFGRDHGNGYYARENSGHVITSLI